MGCADWHALKADRANMMTGGEREEEEESDPRQFSFVFLYE